MAAISNAGSVDVTFGFAICVAKVKSVIIIIIIIFVVVAYVTTIQISPKWATGRGEMFHWHK